MQRQELRYCLVTFHLGKIILLWRYCADISKYARLEVHLLRLFCYETKKCGIEGRVNDAKCFQRRSIPFSAGRSRGRRWRLCRGGRKPRRVGQIPLARARKAIEAVGRRRRTVIVWHWKKGKKEGGKTGGGGGGAAPPQIFRSVQSAQTDDRHWKCSGKTAGKMEILDIVDSGRHCFATARLCEQNLSSNFRLRCNQFPKHWLAKSWRI